MAADSNLTNVSMTSNTTVPDDTYVTSILCKVIGIPLAVAIVLGNLLFIIVLSRSKKSPANIITINLTIADILAGIALVLNFALETYFDGLDPSNHINCRLWAVIQLLPLYLQFVFLMFLNVDRYLTVTRPATYPDTYGEKKMWALCILLWCYSLCFAGICFAFSNKRAMKNFIYRTTQEDDFCEFMDLVPTYLLTVLIVHTVPTTLISTVIYFRIRHVLRMHQRKIQVTNTLTYDQLIVDISIAKVYFATIVCTFIIWCPFLISTILWFVNDNLLGIITIIRFTVLCGYLTSLKFIALIIGLVDYKTTLCTIFFRNNSSGINRRASNL